MPAKLRALAELWLLKWLWRAALLVVLWPVLSHALELDKEQPLTIEAGQAELDHQQRVAIYKTEVLITQGSLRLRGDIATVYYSADNRLERLILIGSPAEFRQQADHQSSDHNARADRISYSVDDQTIVLQGNANYTGEYTISADRISYNIADGRIAAGQAAAETEAESPASTAGQRVRVTIPLPQQSPP